MGGRFAVLIGVSALAYLLLLFKLYDIQITNGRYYLARAESQRKTPASLEAKRGAIYFTDKNGNLVAAALNKDFPVIFAVPKDIDDSEEVAHELAPLLGQEVEAVEKKLNRENDPYELLLNKADPEIARKIDELKVKGVYVTAESQRFYPFGSLASHLIGFVGPVSDGVGKKGHYGLEGFYEERLAGVLGKDLILTIDPNIQIEAERIVAELAKIHEAAGGGVIVMDPQTGKILALAGAPNFDLNSYGEADLADFLNPMVQKIYEPGSIFKVITMAAGIDSGKITPETVYIDKGSLTLNGRTIENYDLKTRGPYGRVTMTNVIEHSINTGAVFAEREMGRDIFTSYVKKFGFGEKTGVTLPGELKGDVKRLNPKERDITFATASYGQGVAVTPLGLITAVSAIANGGNLMRPFLDAEIESQVTRRVISGETARKVTEMMISAVDKAEVAAIPGYRLAGKTGTAFVPDFKKGGYTDKVINTYVGFGPATDARFVVLIKLDEPAGAPVAALTVVPAFRDLAQFILNYYNIPPDRLTTSHQK